MESRIVTAKKIFPPFVIRLSIITSIAVSLLLLLITNTAKKAHSDSEVSYRQESVFEGAGYGATAEVLADNTSDETVKTSISYEVDQVTPTPTPVVVVASQDNDIWIQIAQCESKQNWSIDTGNGYYGGLQFSLGAWASVGGTGKPSDASKDEQIERGKMLQAKRGWGVWGMCAKKLGLN